ncbi:hypothetical protein P4S63_22315 [Pseudoalteromonas sp. B193]
MGLITPLETLITNQVFRVPFSHLELDVATLQSTLMQGAKQQCKQVYEHKFKRRLY